MSCSCSSGQNQTHEKVFQHFASQKQERSTVINAPDGTGIFLIPAPEIGIFEAKKILVENISYVETVKRGQNCIAFSYVPTAILKFSEIQERPCGNYCPLTQGYCHDGCICNIGYQVCQ
jgi:hypothetical protein